MPCYLPRHSRTGGENASRPFTFLHGNLRKTHSLFLRLVLWEMRLISNARVKGSHMEEHFPEARNAIMHAS